MLWGVDRGVRGVGPTANSAVRGILVKVAFSCKMEQKGTEADQKGGGNQKQQGKAQKRQEGGRPSCLWICTGRVFMFYCQGSKLAAIQSPVNQADLPSFFREPERTTGANDG